MQKRTNPLELKVEAKPIALAPELIEAEVIEPDAQDAAIESLLATPEAPEEALAEDEVVITAEPAAESVSEAVQTVASASEDEEQKEADAVVEPVRRVRKKAAKPVEKTAPLASAPAPKAPAAPSVIAPEEPVRVSASADMRWQRVVSSAEVAPAAPRTQTAPAKEIVEPTPATATFFRPVVEEEPEQAQPTYEAYEEPENEIGPEQPAEQPACECVEPTGERIEDEEEPLVIEDYEMSVRFGLCGRVTRGTKWVKVSRDVCRLAQLMHPNQSLSTILENALLTRIYLENRDAFDAMAEMIEKKGGHIKC